MHTHKHKLQMKGKTLNASPMTPCGSSVSVLLQRDFDGIVFGHCKSATNVLRNRLHPVRIL